MLPILNQLKEKIQSKISELNYNTWIKPILNADISDEKFTLLVPNKFVADWINDYYSDLIHQELSEITQKSLKICYEVAEAQTISSQHIAKIPDPASLPRAKTIANLNPKYTFNRFVVGSSNQFVHAACMAVADLPGGHYNPLFIYGGVGLGKTHLLHAIGLQISQQRPDTTILYVSSETFTNEVINGIRYDKMPELRRKYREHLDVLLIDDIQFLAGKERTQDEFFYTFNALHDSQRQLIITSDKLPKEIPGIEDRLRSRFEWGLIADIQPPDLETRVAILKRKAEAENIVCPDDVAMFLASSIKSNVRELEGSLIRLYAFASLTKSTINLDLTKEVLKNIIQDKPTVFSIEAIQRTVADFYKVSISDLKSPVRTKTLAYPRQIAMYLCKKLTQSSFPEVGLKFGGKDHTTVMHACKKIESLLKENSALQEDINIIKKTIRH
ncbi:MAG: chromosomal replication initiator protein DnaA [Deltaproteobacteria bacterium CG07_land_8_20_14_0_80_38_7]|nr:MAG: chromosomal replication initiator protein DnaA [Deltaproteobacteria bacterium CG07_land_8_20_14_0_80_38_7]